METFDLIIVGSGSGNSIPDFLSDKRIAIVERGVFGGTCLNVGCIPSKMFVLPADVAYSARHGSRLGVNSSVDSVEWSTIRDRVFGRIDPISQGGEKYRATGTPNVELIKGTASFVEDRILEVDDREITAPQVLLAAGARPAVPPIPGLADIDYHTSDSIMRLESLPKRLAIIGAGFIAVELGHVFSSYGSDVTMYNRSSQMLRHHDNEISTRFTEVFSERVELVSNAKITAVSQSASGVRIETESGTQEFDQLLVATGRQPNSDLLRAARAGLEIADDGRIVTDATMKTNVEGIWAVGDITNKYQLKHLANAEAKVAFWNIAHPDDQREADDAAVPHAVFSKPQVASVGLTEEAAQASSIEYVTGRRDYGGTAYGWALEDTTSFAKVLLDPATKRILGAHILGEQAATLLQPLIQAMQFGQTADRLANDVFYIHPALTEVVENALLDGLSQIE